MDSFNELRNINREIIQKIIPKLDLQKNDFLLLNQKGTEVIDSTGLMTMRDSGFSVYLMSCSDFKQVITNAAVKDRLLEGTYFFNLLQSVNSTDDLFEKIKDVK